MHIKVKHAQSGWVTILVERERERWADRQSCRNSAEHINYVYYFTTGLSFRFIIVFPYFIEVENNTVNIVLVYADFTGLVIR